MAHTSALLVLGALVWMGCPVTSIRALGLFPSKAHSHNVMFRALMEALSERGHLVTMLSPFPQKAPRPNYTDIDLSELLPPLVNTFVYSKMTSGPSTSINGVIDIIGEIMGNDICRKVFGSRQFQDILKGVYGTFDVVLTEIFGTDCFAAVANKMQVPLIGMVSLPDLPWMHSRVGSIDNPSYIPNMFQNFLGSEMTLWQRARNVVTYVIGNALHQSRLIDGSDEVVREFLGAGMPPLADIVRNTSLILVNRHMAVDAARPVNPNVVHVGGLHVRGAWRAGKRSRPRRLEPWMQAWLDGADEHGAILFTLGSLMQMSSLPADMLTSIFQALGSLPHRVLLKYETERADLPPNVRIAKWLPQGDILTHPKLVLFVTHGGLMGTQEALVAGVPMLGIPLYGDQWMNMHLYRSQGIAELLDHHTLDKDHLLSTLQQMTGDDRYLRRAREVSALYLDRPRSAEAEAVWWVEYVVRNSGAPHLRPRGADLPLHQYLLLDVIALVVVVLIIFSLLTAGLLRAALDSTRRQDSPSGKVKNQ